MKRKSLIVLLLLSGCSPVKEDTNRNVNEHNFVKVCRGGTESDAAMALGNPDSQGEGEIVRFTRPTETVTSYTIAEVSEKSSPDYYQVFRGSQREQIRLLYENQTKVMIAAEYLVDDIPVFYHGRKNATARQLSLANAPTVSAAAAPELLSRRKTLSDFFNENLVSKRRGPTVSPSAPPESKNAKESSIAAADVKTPAKESAAQEPSKSADKKEVADEPASKIAGKKESAAQEPSRTADKKEVADEPASKIAVKKESAAGEIPKPNSVEQSVQPAGPVVSAATGGPGMMAGAAAQPQLLSPGTPPVSPPEPAVRNWVAEFPSGDKLTNSVADMPDNWLNKCYPMGCNVQVAYHPNGVLQLVVSLNGSKLQGTTTGLYRSGSIATIANYDQNRLVGPLRLWGQDKEMVLYSEYMQGKKAGYTAYFEKGEPVVFQQWQAGSLVKEYFVKATQPSGDGAAAPPAADVSRLSLVSEDELPAETVEAIHERLKELNARILKNESLIKEKLKSLPTVAKNTSNAKRKNTRASGSGHSTASAGALSAPLGLQWRNALSNSRAARGIYQVPVIAPFAR